MALASAKPCITRGGSAMQQLLGERNVAQAISLVPEEDPRVLANAIISLYVNYNSIDTQTLSTLT